MLGVEILGLGTAKKGKVEPTHGGPWLSACEFGVIVRAYRQWEATMTLPDKEPRAGCLGLQK